MSQADGLSCQPDPTACESGSILLEPSPVGCQVTSDGSGTTQADLTGCQSCCPRGPALASRTPHEGLGLG